jgi:hypothetical protein
MTRLIVALSLCCFLSPAWAADPWGKYSDYGVPTCKSYLEAVATLRGKPGEKLSDAQIQKSYGQFHRSWGWITGYLTSYNMNVPDTYDIIGNRPAKEQLAVEDYCKEHPGNDFAQMMGARTKELYFMRLRQKHASEY